MDEFRVTKNGLIIPRSWMKGFGARVSVERRGEMLIVEPPGRAAARRRLTKAVARIRAAGRGLSVLLVEKDDLAAHTGSSGQPAGSRRPSCRL